MPARKCRPVSDHTVEKTSSNYQDSAGLRQRSLNPTSVRKSAALSPHEFELSEVRRPECAQLLAEVRSQVLMASSFLKSLAVASVVTATSTRVSLCAETVNNSPNQK